MNVRYADPVFPRTVALSLLAVTLAVTTAFGQEWAEKMFDHTSHDFGTVVGGTKVEHRFSLENIYAEDVWFSAVGACACCGAHATKLKLKTREKAEIVVRMSAFHGRGKREFKPRVFFVEPFGAEVVLNVQRFLRRDICVSEKSIRFDSVPAGEGAERTATIRYAGRPDWEIWRVECDNPHLEAMVKKVSAKEKGETTRLDYQLVVKLSHDAPVGSIEGRLIIVTNDPEEKGPRFPIIVEGKVVALDEPKEPADAPDQPAPPPPLSDP